MLAASTDVHPAFAIAILAGLAVDFLVGFVISNTTVTLIGAVFAAPVCAVAMRRFSM
jgi:hypothetical protein